MNLLTKLLPQVAIVLSIALTLYIVFTKIHQLGYQKGVKSVEQNIINADKACEEKLAAKDSVIVRLAQQPKTQINVKKIKDNGKLYQQ